MSLSRRSRILAAMLAVTLTVPTVTTQAAPKKDREHHVSLETTQKKETESESETQSESATEPESETQSESETEEISGAEEVISTGSSTPKTNEELVEAQEIIQPPTAEKSFRFTTVKRNYAVSKRKNIYFMEEMKEDAKKVGILKKRAVIYLLSEEEDGWYYAESGDVRGFIQAESLYVDEKAQKMRKVRSIRRAEDAEALVDPFENEAFTYTQTTAANTVVDKVYAMARQDIEILDAIPQEKKTDEEELPITETEQEWEETESEEPKEEVMTESEEPKEEVMTESEEPEEEIVSGEEENQEEIEEPEESELETEEPAVVGTLEKNGFCCVLSETEEGNWLFVESGDVRGFVRKSSLRRGNGTSKMAETIGEDSIVLAEEIMEPQENRACYYTLTSTEEASVSNSIRTSMIRYAEQFLGNPYIWGGISLTKGADCSGFVQSIYRDFGYGIPRVAEDQAQVGIKIPVESAEPGDLIFYARNGYIYHVVMSMGGNHTIEAQSSATGIVYGNVNYNNAVWAVRIISDEDRSILKKIQENGLGVEEEVEFESAETYTYGEKLGNFKLTSYCSCPICCGVWSGGPTASGAMPSAGRTVAMAGVPFGTKLIIDGKVYVVEDRGTPYGHADIYMNSHEAALQFGVQYADVYLAE